MKRPVRFFLLLAVLLSVNSCVVGHYLCKTALRETPTPIEDVHSQLDKRFPGLKNWYDSLRAEGVFHDTTVMSCGHRIHAVYAAAPCAAQGTAILIHGYTDNHLGMMILGRMYRDSLNYNIFLPDLYYHGQSEGDHIQMGWFDRKDVENLIPVAESIFHDAFMVLHGISMGGATVMMTSGDRLPGYVKAIVDDCGYTTVWDQFSYILRRDYHLPAFPVLNSANVVCRKKYGWDFKEASCVEQLEKCELPVLFIHGGSDYFVPTEYVYRNYDAKSKGYRELWVAPGSGHAHSYRDYPAEYTARVREFLSKVRGM